MDEHDDDLESTVLAGEEVERDAYNIDAEPLGKAADESSDDTHDPNDDTIDDAEL